MDFHKRRPRKEHESIIPLINVVFLLVIFFLLAGTVQEQELWTVEPPSSVFGEEQAEESTLLLMDADGRIALEDREIPLEALESELAKLQEAGSLHLLQLKADASVDAKELIDVLETLREAGIESLELIAQVEYGR